VSHVLQCPIVFKELFLNKSCRKGCEQKNSSEKFGQKYTSLIYLFQWIIIIAKHTLNQNVTHIRYIQFYMTK